MVDQLALRNAAVEQHMGDVRAELSRVSELVASLQRERAEQQGRVETRLSEMAAVSARLVDTTHSLRQALANPRARGQWGERMADDVLRAAGLVEGISYRKQSATAAGTVPDFTFMLPGDRVLHMDVKFPVDNYLRHLEATSERERDQHAIAFVRDVRARVRELSSRVYIDPDGTLDEVLLFIPNEAVYAFAHQHDRDLLDVALQQKVVLCSPSTLFSVLAVIRQAVEQTQLQRTSDEILACLAAFEQQWGKFSDALDKVGRSLDTVRRSWDDLSGTRRRQLERQLDRVGELRTRRELGRDSGPGHEVDVAIEVGHTGVAGDAEARRRATGEILPLPRPPASAAG
jgi:DNA recombination protein RmuC